MGKVRLRRGDKVVVLSGKHKGQKGVIQTVYPKTQQVVIEGVNLGYKVKKIPGQKPERTEVAKPLGVAKVGIIEPKSGQPSRIFYRTDDKGVKRRYFTKNKQEIPRV